MHLIRLGDREIGYRLRRSARRRTVGLKIDQAGLLVSVPARLPQRAWEAVLVEKSRWVLDKLAALSRHATAPFEWRDGQLLPFLGAPLELMVERGGPRGHAALDDGALRVRLRDPADAAALQVQTIRWYRREALAFFHGRVAVYARQLGVAAASLALSNARTRWGSCTARGAIRLNWRLVKAPPAVIDYVVVHELAHILELNHSRAFWAIVSQACPDYASLRAQLKEQSAYYHQF